MAPPSHKNNVIEMTCVILYVLSTVTLLYASPVVFCAMLVGAFTLKVLQDLHERLLLYPTFLESMPMGMGIVTMEVSNVLPFVMYHLHATYQGESHHFEGDLMSLLQQMRAFRTLHKV